MSRRTYSASRSPSCSRPRIRRSAGSTPTAKGRSRIRFPRLPWASVTLLALAAAIGSRRRSAGWMTGAGWAAVALTTAALTYFELSVSKRGGPISVVDYADHLGLPWPVLVSPLVVVFVLAMWLFVRHGRVTQATRSSLTLGIACWVFALVLDALDAGLFAGRASATAHVLEETLEYGGTLLIGLSAVFALRHGRSPPSSIFGSRWRRSLVGVARGTRGAWRPRGGISISCAAG